MRRLLAILSVGALAALVVPTTAGAQSIRDIPEAGDAVCDGIETLIGEAGGGGAPDELTGGLQQIHDAACGAGEAPDDDDGDESAGPHCDVFDAVISGLGDAGAPAEVTGGIQQLADAAGCTSGSGGGGGDTTTTTAPSGDDDTTTTTGGDDTTTEVAGATGTGGAGGTPLPVTGGGLLAGGAGFGLLALAGLVRRFFGTA